MSDSRKVEEIAKIIDPEAFGLPNNIEDGTITDRDEARDRARLVIAALAPSPSPVGVDAMREALVEAGKALSFYGESDVITGRIVDGKISHIDDDGDTARKALAALRAALASSPQSVPKGTGTIHGTPGRDASPSTRTNEQVRDDFNRLYELLWAIRDLPEMPSPMVLRDLSTAGKFPEDWNVGKRLQIERGLEFIPPVTECEIGAGLWSRLRTALLASAPSPSAGGDLSSADADSQSSSPAENLEAEEKEMFRLADRLGYVCLPEPPHPDSPHAPRPIAWTIPGDDTADANGFIPCRVAEAGEFTKPLYAHAEFTPVTVRSSTAPAVSGEGWMKEAATWHDQKEREALERSRAVHAGLASVSNRHPDESAEARKRHLGNVASWHRDCAAELRAVKS